MRTLTFLMGRETSFRIFLLCLFFISEILFIQFLDAKIPNNGEHEVYIGKIRICTYLLPSLYIGTYRYVHRTELACREV